jgi:hypothetical protein
MEITIYPPTPIKIDDEHTELCGQGCQLLRRSYDKYDEPNGWECSWRAFPWSPRRYLGRARTHGYRPLRHKRCIDETARVLGAAVHGCQRPTPDECRRCEPVERHPSYQEQLHLEMTGWQGVLTMDPVRF